MNYLEEIFGEDGKLARHLRGYRPRKGQIQLTRAVERAIADGSHLLAEAPTGTGKSLGYAVPAISHVLKKGGRVMIVTANISLQEQLVNKDLPLLRKVLPQDFEFALLKGRSNYLCLDRLEDDAENTQLDLQEDATQLNDIRSWARNTRAGDRSELPFEPSGSLWQRFSVGPEDCKGRQCPCAEQCHANRARDRAMKARVIVTNFHLFCTHLGIQARSDRSTLLPASELVILDEAHRLADIARHCFGFGLSHHAVQRAAAPLLRIRQQSLHKELTDTSREFFTRLEEHRCSGDYRWRLRSPDVVDSVPLQEQLQSAYEMYRNKLDKVGPDEEDLSGALNRASDNTFRLNSNLRQAMSLADSNAVVYLEASGGNMARVQVKQLDVAKDLAKLLFQGQKTGEEPSENSRQPSSVVLTSATLSVNEDFSHVKRELGIASAYELSADTPFDFGNCALLVVPEGLPAPDDAGFPAILAKVCKDVICQTRGRTLALFTSYQKLRIVRDGLQKLPCRILCQGDAPRLVLTTQFREDESSVLLGTESFWTGMDVPGPSLSCVIIDRLPFSTPGDPTMDALKAKDPKSFFPMHALPRAVMQFRQGVGRLIRSQEDRGVVVVLDNRLLKRDYGKYFLNSLPPMKRTGKITDISDFLGAEPWRG